MRNGQPATVEKTVLLQRKNDDQIYGTGHHAVIQKPGTDEWFVFYNRFQRPRAAKLDWSAGYNREVCSDQLFFNPDGTLQAVIPSR